MKKFFVSLAMITISLLGYAQDCETVAEGYAGNAVITFVRYPNKHLKAGPFTINGSEGKVRFAQGNLQYRAKTNKWRFAENQWDIIGSDNTNISDSYNGWIDLFGWGTSGYDNGSTAYEPWATSVSADDYYNVNIAKTNADWGYENAIINGGLVGSGPAAGQWYLLTIAELRYIFETRDRHDALYGAGTLMGVYGIYLLPDDWDWTTIDGGIFEDNWAPATKDFSDNSLNDATVWKRLEDAGAVFLPVAGIRKGSSMYYQTDKRGFYWSGTKHNSYKQGRSLQLRPDNNSVGFNQVQDFYYGGAVRLVQAYTE